MSVKMFKGDYLGDEIEQDVDDGIANQAYHLYELFEEQVTEMALEIADTCADGVRVSDKQVATYVDRKKVLEEVGEILRTMPSEEDIKFSEGVMREFHNSIIELLNKSIEMVHA